MIEGRISALSKRLSWLLRHGARQEGLAMDAAGWADRGAVLAWLGVEEAALEAVIRENNKARFQVDGPRLRASQGHSLEGAPVTLEALEASWAPWSGAGPLWHGTSIDALPGIAREGLKPIARTHVHLAATAESKVGKRAGVHVLLAVDPGRLAAAGRGVYVSPNGVVLVRDVPPGCIAALRAMTKRARAQEAALRALFTL